MRKKDARAAELSVKLEGAEPATIVQAALELAQPVKSYVGFSGGFDSLVAAHWCMGNVPDCAVFHANTGIGIERTREFVRQTCKDRGWPLREIRAKEDCGQDYEQIVLKHGFPGPPAHSRMFQRLKERPVRHLLMTSKKKRSDNIIIFTGIRKDESVRRSGYKYTLLDFVGNVLWVNPFYYKSKDWFRAYIEKHGLQQNPVSVELGMSGECLCGAFAHPGELELIKIVDEGTYRKLRLLENKVRAAGHDWGWEDRPPRDRHRQTRNMFMPMCVGCEKGPNG